MQKCTDRKAIAWIWALGKCAVMQSFLFRLNFFVARSVDSLSWSFLYPELSVVTFYCKPIV